MQTVSDTYKAIVSGVEQVVDDRITVRLPIERANLCLTPSFQYGVGPWTISAPSLITSPTQEASSDWAMRDGGSSLKITWSELDAYNGATLISVDTKIGTFYRLTAWVKAEAGSPAVVIGQTATTVIEDFSDPSDPDDTDPQQLDLVFSAEGPAVYLLLMNYDAATADTVTYVDRWVLEEVSGAAGGDDDWDGDDENCRWLGLPGKSASVQNVDPYPDLSLAVESWRVDRQLTTDMPDGTRLLGGYPAASATVVLSGLVVPGEETKDAAWLFNPWSTTSPLYRLDPTGSEVVIENGVYTTPGEDPELLTIFSGEVDECEVDPLTGTVTLTCIDARNRLRGTAEMPPVASTTVVGGGWAYQPGLVPTYGLDYLLRRAGIHSAPPPRDPLCIFYVSNHGSMWPEISGANTEVRQTDQSPYPTVEGKWFPQLQPVGYAEADFNGFYTEVEGLFLEWWQKFDTSGGFGGTGADVAHLSFSAGLTFYIYEQADNTLSIQYLEGELIPLGISAGEGTPWRHLAIQVDGWNLTYTVWVDGEVIATGTPTVDELTFDSTAISWQSPIEAFQCSIERFVLPRTSFTPTAYFDRSLNETMIALPDSAGTDPWQVAQKIGDAEQAIAGFDEDLTFRFRNRHSILSGTSVREITSTKSLKTIKAKTAKSTIATRVQVPVNDAVVQPIQPVWAASAAYAIKSGETLKVRASISPPAAQVIAQDYRVGVIPSGGFDYDDADSVWSGYRASTKADGTGPSMTRLVMSVTQDTIASVTISIYNPYTVTAYLCSPSSFTDETAGSPMLKISGYPITSSATTDNSATSTGTTADAQWPPADFGGAASNPRGDITLALPANEYRQNLGHATELADDLLADLYTPRPLFDTVDVVPDSSLQLTDRVTLKDPEALIVAEDAMVTSITRTGGKGNRTMQLGLRAVAPPGSWVMGIEGRSEIGSTTYV